MNIDKLINKHFEKLEKTAHQLREQLKKEHPETTVLMHCKVTYDRVVSDE